MQTFLSNLLFLKPMENCESCNKKADDLVDGLCAKCFLRKNPIVESVKTIRASICKNCGKYSTHKGFSRAKNKEEIVNNIIKKTIKFNPRYSKVELDVVFPHEIKDGIEVEVNVSAKLDKKTVRDSYVFPLTIKQVTCGMCSRETAGYYEGILQIRNTESENYPLALDYVKLQIERVRKRGVFAVKYAGVPNGVDVYITDKSYMDTLAHEVFLKFGGEVKKNERLFSQNKMTSRLVYRVAVLVRLPDISPGDILQIGKDTVVVRKLGGKHLTGLYLQEKKYKDFNYVDKEYTIVAKRKDLKEVEVIKVKPQVEILDPESYESVPVQNPEEGMKIGQKVKVFSDGRVWLV